MPLTRTVSILPMSQRYRAGWTAAMHRDLLLALDEILIARYNSRSPRVFNATPQLQQGQTFCFRDSGFSNLNVTGSQYDASGETPPDPDNAHVVTHDATTKVITLTGYSHPATLNRRQVTWSPTGDPEDEEDWWILNPTGRPERFLALGVAEIYVEDYTDPVASDNETFTWRSHWDKYGCIRIHNGNRHTLTLVFEGGAQSSVQIPPYGILSGRRVNHDQPFEFPATYLHLTRQGDPLKWEGEHAGQYAANLEYPIDLRNALGPGIVRMRHDVDVISTAQEMGAFTGAPPEPTDYQQDWLIHKGKLLSVVLDKRDGSISTHELTWNGVGSVPDATWADHVLVEFLGVDNQQLRFTSQVDAPGGAEDNEWEHDLIPISTNLTGGQILSLRAAPVTIGIRGNPSRPLWTRLPWAEVIDTGSYNYRLRYVDHDGTTDTNLTHTRIALDFALSGGSDGGLDIIEDRWAEPTDPASIDVLVDEVIKAGSTLARRRTARVNPAAITGTTSLGIGIDLDAGILYVDTSEGDLRWTMDTSTDGSGGGRRFVAWEPRWYMTSGDLEDWHPQDIQATGTTDGLGGDVGWAAKPTISKSPVMVEGHGVWDQTTTNRGRSVYLQDDVLHVALTNIQTASWWLDNRDDVIAGTIPVANRNITWRVPRLPEEWNSLANSINRIVEVFPATVRDLFLDPLAVGLVGPFPHGATVATNGHMVPWGAVAGRYDTDDDTLADWCATWGVSIEVGAPGLATLQSAPRRVWAIDIDDIPGTGVGQGPQPYQWRLADASDFVSEGGTTTNGHTYTNWLALTAARQTALYGGSGSAAGYKWVSYDALAAVFAPLGVPVPPPPCGMRCDPTISEHTAFTQIKGTLFGAEADSSSLHAEAQTLYLLPSDTGAWCKVINDGGECRLMDVAGTMTIRFETSQVIDMGEEFGDPWTYELVVREITETAEALYRNEHSPIGYSVGMPRRTSDPTEPAWPTLERIDCPTPVLALVTNEAYVVRQWIDPIPDPADPQATLITDLITGECVEPAEAGWMVLELDAGTITPETLRQAGAGDGEWRCFHVQLLPRTGVLRS